MARKKFVRKARVYAGRKTRKKDRRCGRSLFRKARVYAGRDAGKGSVVRKKFVRKARVYAGRKTRKKNRRCGKKIVRKSPRLRGPQGGKGSWCGRRQMSRCALRASLRPSAERMRLRRGCFLARVNAGPSGFVERVSLYATENILNNGIVDEIVGKFGFDARLQKCLSQYEFELLIACHQFRVNIIPGRPLAMHNL